jgi:hypothetical protein
MLTPQLQQLLEALTTLKELPQTPGVVCQDEFGGNWAIAKAFAIGSRTDDPGLVIRLQAQRAGLCRHCGDTTELSDDPAPNVCAMCAKAGHS